MASRLFGAKCLSEPMLPYYKLHIFPWKLFEIQKFEVNKMHLTSRLQNGGHFVSASMCQVS